MKRFRIFGMGVLLWASINSHAAQTAQATLFCLSVRFHRATSPDGQFTLDLTTLNPSVGLNGELAPTFLDPPEPGYYSRFYEYDTIFDEGFDGYIQFDVPMEADVDDNGFADFFETRQSVSGTTTGDYDASPLDRGTVKAIWSRAAGSKDGTCTLQMKSAMFGQLPDFVHAFEIIEFTGPLNYTPDTNKVSGTLTLTQTGDSTSLLAGPIGFTKSLTNRFDKLTLQHEVWTNASADMFKISNDVDFFLRNLTLKTNYHGFVDFEDGAPSTSDPDYLTWVLSIDDTNDSDNDGIPDFSDDPGPIVDRLPLLSLSLGSTNLLLSIRPGLGNVYEVQRVDSLSQTNWTVVLSPLTVTNDPQTVLLPLPTNAAAFWRVHVL